MDTDASDGQKSLVRRGRPGRQSTRRAWVMWRRIRFPPSRDSGTLGVHLQPRELMNRRTPPAVLLVEGRDEFRAEYVAALRPAGLEVIAVDNSQAALEAL